MIPCSKLKRLCLRRMTRNLTVKTCSIRNGAKLLLIVIALSFFALCILSTTVHSFIKPIYQRTKNSYQKRLFYQFDHIGLVQRRSTWKVNDTEMINPHSFNYTILETDICKNRPDPLLVTVVHTHPAHYKRRMAIRETWGGWRSKNEKLLVLFMMGSVSDNPSLMDVIRAESEHYGDIVQEDFEDTYRNLTHKAIMWLKWSSTYCPNVAYLLKVDDDIFVNRFNLISHLKRLHSRGTTKKRSILCLVWHRMQVVRNPESKWYVSKDEYPDDYFSNYCSGSAYILTGDLLSAFYEQALRTKFFWIDDFYITGLLPRALGNVHYHNLGSLYALKQAEVKNRLVYKNALFGHIPGSIGLRYELWREILKWKDMKKSKNSTGF